MINNVFIQFDVWQMQRTFSVKFGSCRKYIRFVVSPDICKTLIKYRMFGHTFKYKYGKYNSQSLNHSSVLDVLIFLSKRYLAHTMLIRLFFIQSNMYPLILCFSIQYMIITLFRVIVVDVGSLSARAITMVCGVKCHVLLLHLN